MFSRFAQTFYLGLLTIALGYGVVQHGGDDLADWNVCLLILGLTAIVYWLRTSSADLAPPMEPWLGWAVLLLPSYVAFQLLPLPLFLLKILSPARAGILENLAHVMQPVAFAPLSVDPATTFAYLFRIIGYTLIFLLIREIAWRSPRERAWAPAIPLIVIASLEAGLGLLQSVGGVDVQGTYWNKNHFAGLLEMVLPIAVASGIALISREDPPGSSAILRALKTCAVLSIAVAILVALGFSLSRAGFVAGLFGLFFMGALALWGIRNSGKKRMAAACLAAFFLLAFIYLPPDQLVGRFGALFGPQAAARDGRLPIWGDTLHLIRAYPLFGSGLGSYDTAFLRYQTVSVEQDYSFAHNDYLELAAELGSVGFLIVTGLMLAILVKAICAARYGRDRNTRYLGLGCAGAMAAMLIHSLADFNMYIPANALLLAWVSGISTSLPLRSAPSGSVHALPSPIFFKRLGIVLSCLLITYAPAWILFDAAFQSDPRAEGLFCRFGICDTDAVVTAQTLEHGGRVASVPVIELREALRRDASAPDRWCDLGEAMLQSGRVEQAGYCFVNALALAPNIPPIQLRAADFFYGVQDNRRALEQTALILGKTSTYDNLIFDWYKAKNVAVADILSYGLPPDRRPAQSYLRYLLDMHKVTDAEKVWNWVLSHNYADDRLASDYLEFLFRDEQYETAAYSWVLYLGDRRNGYRQSNWLYNGDFESELSGSAFDWRIENLDGTEAVRDSTVAHSGGQSLRIHFDGKANVA